MKMIVLLRAAMQIISIKVRGEINRDNQWKNQIMNIIKAKAQAY